MTTRLADIIKANAKKNGITFSADGLELDDRIVELTHLEANLTRTINNFAREAKEFFEADVNDSVKERALLELAETNNELGDAVESLQIVYRESMFLTSTAKEEDMTKLMRKYNAIVNKITKFCTTPA